MREQRTLSQKLSARKPLALVVLALVAAVAAVSFPWLATRAQHTGAHEPVVNVTGVSVRPTGSGEVVTLTGDAPLSRAQTWQDEEGFHVVGYKWAGAFAGAGRGIKVRRVGDSLEIVIPVRAGASVTVSPRGNSLEVVVAGGLRADETRAVEQTSRQQAMAQTNAQARAQKSAPQRAESAQSSWTQNSSMPSKPSPRANASRTSDFIESKEQSVAAARELLQGGGSKQKNAAARAQSAQQPDAPTALFKSTQTNNHQSAPTQSATNSAKAENPAIQIPATQNNQAQNAPVQNPATQDATTQAGSNSASTDGANQVTTYPASPAQLAAQSPQNALVPATSSLTDATASSSFDPSFSSLTVVGVFLFAGLLVFLFIYRRRQRAVSADVPEEVATEKVEKVSKTKGAQASKSKSPEVEIKEEKIVRAPAKVEGISLPEKPDPKFALPAPPVKFGAFRVDQEVEKLLRGEPHSIDVLASRASEDRRAVEASLLKSLASPELIEHERDRARHALEEYGFVARQSAAVLLAPDAYGRSAAARTLGQVKSAASLPFLLEALYDADTVVRTEAVASLGELGLPRAIGALLDAARRHPEIPQSLVTDALNACSLDALDFEGLGLLGDSFTGEIKSLEPVAEVDQLPEWLEDETLAEALERMDSADVEARVAAAHQLSQYPVRRAVDALAALASHDRDASVRAAAITSLGLINHESVFAAILIAMADESREVRAASARALSRLNFDRADAYVRVLETSDDETLRRTAQACVTAGLARQAMDRLASEDRRQAYEAFSLLSLVARGGQTEVIVHVVKGHPDLNVRLAAARLLALQGDAEVDRKLRQIALEGNTPEKLREAIMEVCERRSQPRDGADAGASRVSSESLPVSAEPMNESDKTLRGIA